MKIVWKWFLGRNNTFFLTKKKLFWPNRFNTSLNLLLENDKHGPTTQKLKMGWKRQKLVKLTENSMEIVFMTKNQTKVFLDKTFFHQTWAKTLKSIWNLLKNKQFGETATKLKVGKGRWKLSNFTKNRWGDFRNQNAKQVSFNQKHFI